MTPHELPRLLDARTGERLTFGEPLLRGRVRRWQPLRVAGPVFALSDVFHSSFTSFLL